MDSRANQPRVSLVEMTPRFRDVGSEGDASGEDFVDIRWEAFLECADWVVASWVARGGDQEGAGRADEKVVVLQPL